MTSGGPRKGAGRPKLPKKQKRAIAVQVSLSPGQKAWLDDYAKAMREAPASLLYLCLVEKGMPE
jgi:hypothetical protein